MRKLAAVISALALCLPAAASPVPTFKEWQDPQINEINRLPMHAWFNPDKTSPDYLSLDGVWKFKWVECLNDRPADFFEKGFDDSAWGTMPVPGIWEVNGYGDPLYVNIGYAWKTWYRNNPPIVPVEHNHAGSYRRMLDIPSEWAGKTIVLNIGSATSCIYIWVNGKFAGYSEDSKLEAEFDVTDLIVPGKKNLVAMLIFRWCDGTYLEDQDFFRLCGIGRSCYLQAVPRTHFDDIRITTSLSKSYTEGTIDAKLLIGGQAKGAVVKCEVQDASGNIVATAQTTASSRECSLSLPVRNPRLWSAETPYLYKTVFTLVKKNSRQTIVQHVGMREVKIEGNRLLVNGQPVLIKGVNRHEMDPDMGYVITEARALQDIRIMKENNINAVRTCHYPDANEWYALCDKYGIYVVAEANVESHGMGYGKKTLARDPDYALAHMQRNRRNVLRNFNHPSVIVWSLGNEAGNGPNFVECYDWIKSYDKTRPVQYEKAGNGYNTDIRCPMYMNYADCEKYVTDNPAKPFIQCEYAHAMGNSEGGFREYWEMIRKYPGYQGGFVWDFVDQGIRKPLPGGGTTCGYGGDWNDFDPSDDNFCANGLIRPDRILNPHMHEVRYFYQNIWTTLAGDGKIEIYNENFFKGLDDVALDWALLKNGYPFRNGKIDRIDVAPQERETYPLDYGSVDSRDEYVLQLNYVLKESQGLLMAGHSVARSEFVLTQCPSGIGMESMGKAPEVRETEKDIKVRCDAVDIVFCKKSGYLCGYRVGGTECLDAPLRPNFWRAPTDNDMGAKMHKVMAVWNNPSINLKSISHSICGNLVKLVAEYDIPAAEARLRMEYLIDSGGKVLVSEMMKTYGQGSGMPRFGMRMQTMDGFENLCYYGRGPWENYADRKSSAFLGIYRQNVDEQFHPYMRPQETGTKSDVRWWILTNDKGVGFKLEASRPFGASALHFSQEALDEGPVKHHTHPELLTRDAGTHICIDALQQGLGCVNSWSASQPLPEYRVDYADHEFKFAISPKR